MQRIYHLGLLKQGDKLVLEVADSVDQLNCELWKYLGERINTIANLKRNAQLFLFHANQEFKTDFHRIEVRRIASGDYTAGH